MYGMTSNPFREDMKTLYGDWGVDSEIGKLRSVLMRRGGNEIEGITDPDAMAMKELWDPEKVRYQQDQIIELYRSNGIEVNLIEDMDETKPNAIYCRDLVFMTPEGAIIARPAATCSVGEEVYAMRQLVKLGVPIVRTINGDGVFDGACGLWLDRETCMIGYGLRCNQSGLEQVEFELKNMGVKNVMGIINIQPMSL